MIVVTRLGGGQFAINPDLVERIHEAPDTTVFLVDGTSYVLADSMESVLQKILGHRSRVIAAALELGSQERRALAAAPGEGA